jgi:hypothetical protein
VNPNPTHPSRLAERFAPLTAAVELRRSWRARLLTWLATGITDRGRSCPRPLAERILNADFEAACREGAARDAAIFSPYTNPN